MITIQRQSYPSDLKNQEWEVISRLLPEASQVGKIGRPQEIPYREIINSILFITKTGCQWRYLPHDFPPYQTVYYHFNKWKKQGIWKSIHDATRDELRQQYGRNEQPSAGSIDSQSVAGSSVKGQRGYDAGKKVNGRKRHCLVDTLGLIMVLVVTNGSVQDRDGAKLLVERFCQQYPNRRLHKVWVDGAYSGKLVEWVREKTNIIFDVIRRPRNSKGFVLLKKRWVVERTFGWLNQSRRLSKEYEVLSDTSEAFVYIAMTHLMVRRLAKLADSTP